MFIISSVFACVHLYTWGFQDAAVISSFVDFFASELQAELWARAERARGNLTELKPDPTLKDVFHICVGIASLIPIPGCAAAFIASCKIGRFAVDTWKSFQEAPHTPLGFEKQR